MRITFATCASLSCVCYAYSGRPRRSSSETQDRRPANTWGLPRRNSAIWEHPCGFQRGGGSAFDVPMHAAAAGFMKLPSVSVVSSAWYVQRIRSGAHTGMPHTLHTTPFVPPPRVVVFFRSPRLDVVRVPRGLGVFHQVRILRVLRALW